MPKNAPQQSINVLASAAVDSIRIEKISEKDYTVVPIIALVEGAWHSAVAEYPELALASEFGKTPAGWNGRPVTLGHPKREGSFVSAGMPDVFAKDVVGIIFNAHMDEKKLKLEAWLDNAKIDSLGEHAQGELQRLMSGEVVEVSTGLFMDLEESAGVFNGTEFHGIWRDIVPDHLALLSKGTIGACSVADGAGAPRLNQMRTMSKKTIEGEEPMSVKANLSSVAIQRICADGGLLKYRGLGALNDNDVRTALTAALGKENDQMDYWIIAVFPDVFIYVQGWDNTYYQRSYSATDAGAVVLGATVTEVRPVTEFVPIEVQIGGEPTMTVQEKVAALLKGSKAFNEADAAWLEKLSEEQLDKLSVAATAKPVEVAAPEVVATTVETPVVVPAKEIVANAGAVEAPVTVESFLSKAPDEIRSVLQEGISMQQAAKKQLVEQLRSNELCTFSVEELRAMSLPNLDKLAKLAKVPSYAGSVGALTAVNEQPEQDFVPAPPVF